MWKLALAPPPLSARPTTGEGVSGRGAPPDGRRRSEDQLLTTPDQYRRPCHLLMAPPSQCRSGYAPAAAADLASVDPSGDLTRSRARQASVSVERRDPRGRTTFGQQAALALE